jgi:isoleucyl-tRNA synthetase
MKVLADLLDDTSNWFVRRSRRRFWKSEDDGDKAAAYETLHYVLVRLTQLLAPWAPFVTDELWRRLTKGMDLPVSVHLSDWPAVGEFDQEALREMEYVRMAITIGLSKRADAKIKVRQPLGSAKVWNAFKLSKPKSFYDQYLQIISEELNVKKVDFDAASGAKDAPEGIGGDVAVTLDTTITDELKAEGVMRDLVRHIQNLRKTAGLQVDDRITLQIESSDTLVQRAVADFKDVIAQETLASSFTNTAQENSTTAKIDGTEVAISLSKV